jgi:hypothetical protein
VDKLKTKAKEVLNPAHIAHIGKASEANAQTNALPKSAIFLTHLVQSEIRKYSNKPVSFITKTVGHAGHALIYA